MRHISSMYRIINSDLINMIDAVAGITQFATAEHVVRHQVRVEEDPVAISMEALRESDVITAHDLRQYRNKLYSIRLEEVDKDDWFKRLLTTATDTVQTLLVEESIADEIEEFDGT